MLARDHADALHAAAEPRRPRLRRIVAALAKRTREHEHGPVAATTTAR